MYEYKAKCLRVVDGDTFEMDVDLGFHVHIVEKVRLLDIDTPETHGRKKGSPEYNHGNAAKSAVIGMVWPNGVMRDPVQLTLRTRRDKTGKYGRFLADVIFDDGRSLANELRRLGFSKLPLYTGARFVNDEGGQVDILHLDHDHTFEYNLTLTYIPPGFAVVVGGEQVVEVGEGGIRVPAEITIRVSGKSTW